MTTGPRLRMLVIGRRGRLARALQRTLPSTIRARFVGRPELDVTDAKAVFDCVSAERPDVIVNATGLTDALQAEQAPRIALSLNAAVPRTLAMGAKKSGAALVQLSTAEVFDGDLDGPYAEDADPSPRNTLGASKLLGEEFVLHEQPRALILRCGPLLGPSDGAGCISRQAGLQSRLVMPTPAIDLARLCGWIAPLLAIAPQADPLWGITHCAGRGSSTLSTLDQTLLSAGLVAGRAHDADAEKIPAPPSALLDCGRLTQVFGHRMPHWTEAVREMRSLRVSELSVPA